jgi:hypothetical protein
VLAVPEAGAVAAHHTDRSENDKVMTLAKNVAMATLYRTGRSNR